MAPQRAPYRIALLLPIEFEYSNRLIEGALSYVEKHPNLELVEIPYQGERVREIGSPLPAGPLGFDGALLYLDAYDFWAERLVAEGIAAVSASGGWVEKGVRAVAFDRLALVRLTVDYLVSLGRKQAAYIGGYTSDSAEWSKVRDAFIDGASRAGMAVATYEFGSVDGLDHRFTKLSAVAADRLRAFLTGLPKPASVWCEDDYMARVACNHAAAAGLRIPEDLAVLGLGDLAVSRLGRPAISTIPTPGQIIGNRALQWLHEILAGTAEPGMMLRVPPPPLVVRESTCGSLPPNQRLQRIRQWIHDHACEGLTIQDLLKDLPMSLPTFSQRFLQAFGRTPGEEIRQVKTVRAKHYLRTTSFSVERIAGLCGFEQPGKFSAFFRRQTGRTPSEYRQDARLAPSPHDARDDQGVASSPESPCRER